MKNGYTNGKDVKVKAKKKKRRKTNGRKTMTWCIVKCSHAKLQLSRISPHTNTKSHNNYRFILDVLCTQTQAHNNKASYFQQVLKDLGNLNSKRGFEHDKLI